MDIKIVATICLFAMMMLESVATNAEKDAVAIIVDRDVYKAVRSEFDTYIRDVSLRFPVKLIVSRDRAWEQEDPQEIRRLLQELYTEKDIVGAVLVGQIPYTFWERSVDSHYTGINTLYYQELDGEFIDNDNDDRFDEIKWGPNEGPELWVFWMRPPKKDNIRYLRLFFRKCHNYYTGRFRVPYRAMLYAETDYSHMYKQMIDPLVEAYGTDNIAVASWPHRSNPRVVPTLTALESKGYEIMNMNTHGFCMVHSGITPREQDVLEYGGVLTMIYGCHTAAFDEAPNDNLTQGYVFRTKYGMAAAGTSWGAGIPPWKEKELYRHLGEGMYLGKAYGMTEKYDYTPELYESVYGKDKKHWHQNISINMLGNPFVYLMQGKPAGSRDKEQVKVNELDDEAGRIIDDELSRLFHDFLKAVKAGQIKRAELIVKTMAGFGKCALNGRGSSNLRRKMRSFLSTQPYSTSYEHTAALYGNMGTADDREFLIELIEKSEDAPNKQKALSAALGHCCSEEEIDWLLEYIKKAKPDVAAAAATYLDEIVSEEDFPKLAFLLESGNPGLRREYYSIASSYEEFNDFFEHVVKNDDTLPSDVSFLMFRKGFKHPELAGICLRTVFDTEDDHAQNMALWLFSTLKPENGPEIMIKAVKELKSRGVRRRALIEVRRWKDTDYRIFMPYINDKDLWICLTAIETVEVLSGKTIEELTGKIKRDYAETCTEY